MFAGIRSSVVVIAMALLLGAVAAAGPPKLAGPPGDRALLGDAFVEAWLSLRRDLDTLSHGGVHPRLLGEWLAAAPRFLLRDAIRHSSEPQVRIAAASRLARGADDGDRALLAELEVANRGRPLAHVFHGLLIAAGSAEALDRAHDGLDDPRAAVRIDAARALAEAGDRRGLARLRQMVRSASEQADDAARALGAYGAQADDALLIEAGKRLGQGHAIRAARGELALRRAFPDHHLALERFDPAGLRLVTTGGLYDTWLDALGRAIRAGARNPMALVSHVDELRRAPWPGDDEEVVRRRLAALTEFLEGVNARLRFTSPRPAWPADFDGAIERIRGSSTTDAADPAAFAGRVAAAIAICSWTAGRIDHQRLDPPTKGLRFITPGGARTIDGNLATSFRFVAGQRLVIELAAPRAVEELWLASACADGEGARPGRVRVAGEHGDRAWKREATLAAGRYFQRVDLGGERARRLEISFHDLEGKGAACLAEIRIF